jgi:hypothetical protein
VIGEVLQFQDLQELCKPGHKPQLATVEKWAKRIGLRYTFDGDGGIISSVAALNTALGLGPAANDTPAAPSGAALVRGVRLK